VFDETILVVTAGAVGRASRRPALHTGHDGPRRSKCARLTRNRPLVGRERKGESMKRLWKSLSGLSRTCMGLGIVAVVSVYSPGVSHAGNAKTCLTGTDPSVTSDAAQIAAVRTLIDDACPAERFDSTSPQTGTPAYVRCATVVALQAVSAGRLRRQCARPITQTYRKKRGGKTETDCVCVYHHTSNTSVFDCSVVASNECAHDNGSCCSTLVTGTGIDQTFFGKYTCQEQCGCTSGAKLPCKCSNTDNTCNAPVAVCGNGIVDAVDASGNPLPNGGEQCDPGGKPASAAPVKCQASGQACQPDCSCIPCTSCPAKDSCHVAGQCDQNGTCSQAALPIGTQCALTNPGPCVATTGTCQDGPSGIACQQVNLPAQTMCPFNGSDPCSGMCDGNGTCTANAAPDGTQCSNSSPCTTTGTCQSGHCNVPAVASGTACPFNGSDPCSGTCDGSGTCTSNAAPNGAKCPFDGSDSCSGTCESGACTSTPQADNTGCDPNGSQCSGQNFCENGKCESCPCAGPNSQLASLFPRMFPAPGCWKDFTGECNKLSGVFMEVDQNNTNSVCPSPSTDQVTIELATGQGPAVCNQPSADAPFPSGKLNTDPLDGTCNVAFTTPNGASPVAPGQPWCATQIINGGENDLANCAPNLTNALYPHWFAILGTADNNLSPGEYAACQKTIESISDRTVALYGGKPCMDLCACDPNQVGEYCSCSTEPAGPANCLGFPYWNGSQFACH
jgi:hypothetical protein